MVWFIDTLRDKIVYQHPYVALVACESKWRQTLDHPMSIYTGYDALPRRFFVTGRTVYLTGEEKPCKHPAFEGVVKLSGIEKIIFNRITRTIYLHIGKSRDSLQRP